MLEFDLRIHNPFSKYKWKTFYQKHVTIFKKDFCFHFGYFSEDLFRIVISFPRYDPMFFQISFMTLELQFHEYEKKGE